VFDNHYQGTAYLLFAASRHTPPKVRALIDHLVAALGPCAQPV
jgi:DNA-binding transcriptional LysR family regulator